MMAKPINPCQVVRLWDIEGYPTYFFGVDKQLYRIDSRGRYLINRRQLKRYTLGYILKSRFYSLAQLRPLLKKYIPIDRPAGF